MANPSLFFQLHQQGVGLVVEQQCKHPHEMPALESTAIPTRPQHRFLHLNLQTKEIGSITPFLVKKPRLRSKDEVSQQSHHAWVFDDQVCLFPTWSTVCSINASVRKIYCKRSWQKDFSLTLGFAMAKRSFSVGLSFECVLLMTTIKSS